MGGPLRERVKAGRFYTHAKLPPVSFEVADQTSIRYGHVIRCPICDLRLNLGDRIVVVRKGCFDARYHRECYKSSSLLLEGRLF